MKVLIVCQAVDREHQNLGFFVRWIAEFAQRSESVIVIANEVGEYDLPANVTVHSLGKESGASRLGRYMKFISLITQLSGQYDRVFCHMNPEFVIAGSAWWRMSRKQVVLWYVHGTVSWRLRFALFLANGACTTDAESLKINSPKVHRVGHGIDTDFFKPELRVSHTKAFIVSASRISPSKHIDMLVDAIELVRREVQLRASIIGGPATPADRIYEAEVQKRAQRYSSIAFLGPQNQQFVRDALVSADVFLNASTTGSMDKAVLEAAASGVLPISSNKAFRALLEPHGLYVDTLTPEAFAAAIQGALERPDRQRVADTLRAEVVKGHNLSTCIQRILALL